MPYATNEDLPASVRSHLPEHAQEIFREAFNNSWTEFGGDEVRSFRIAWSAVKRKYEKAGDQWVPRA